MFFCDVINNLNFFWKRYGCILLPSFDLEMGAGTYNAATFLKVLGTDNWNTAYVQLTRRPSDGNYLYTSNKRQRFLQYQVLLKPSPRDVQTLYLNSLRFLGINLDNVDIKFIDDNWESPTLGAYGTGWEVSLNGVEISQFTYFQQMGSILCNPISCELTYGLERIVMFLQNVSTISDIVWDVGFGQSITYGNLFDNHEYDFCLYNLNLADVSLLFKLFDFYEIECKRILNFCVVEVAYEFVVKISHIFNILESRAVFSDVEKKFYVSRIRKLANCVAKIYYLQMNRLKFNEVLLK